MPTVTKQGTNNPLSSLLRQLNGMLRGWTNYFRHGVSSATFGYLRHFVWWRVVAWLRHKHRRANWKQLRLRYLLGTSRWPTDGETVLFDTAAVAITRYRFRGERIPTPWSDTAVA